MSATGLRVLQSAPSWLPRTQTWMYTHIRHLPEPVESHVVCDRTEHLDQFPLPHIHSTDEQPWLTRVQDRALRVLGLRRHPGLLVEVGRRVEASLIHSHFGHIGWRDRPAAERLGAHHVVTFYGQDLGYLPRAQPCWGARYRDMFQGVDRVLCEGPHMARGVVDLGCPENKVSVLHLGVDLTRFAFQPRQWEGEGPLRVLLAGSFTEKKGFPLAFAALGEVSKFVDLDVTVIGDANDKPRNRAEKARILDAIRASGLAPRMLGYRSHAEFMAEAYEHHVFLSPSVTASDGDTEGGAPVSIIEAAATGMPVVSSQHADIPEVLPGGLLADERDPQGLVDRFRELVDGPAGWEPLVRSQREHLEAEYDVRTQAGRLAGIYAGLASA